MLTSKEVEDIFITLYLHEKMCGGIEWMKNHKHPLLLDEIRPLDEEEKKQILDDVSSFWDNCEFSFEEEVSPISTKRYTLLVVKSKTAESSHL